MQIAVVGAGLAGLAAASDLQAAGHEVVVWEKSRGVGGRTATRRGPEGMRFDHGAPFLHDHQAPLSALNGLTDYELLLPDGSTQAEVVGADANTAPAKALAAGLDVRPGITVGSISAAGARWILADHSGVDLGPVDAVIVTAPAPQAAELLASCAPGLAERAGTVAFASCWAVMVAWDRPLELPFSASFGGCGLALAVAEAPKPGRTAGERWVLHADADFSLEYLEAKPEDVGRLLMERFAALCGSPLPAPALLAAHRWRFARPATPLSELLLQDGRVLAAGDWCGGATAGAAVRSGRAAAAALLG